MRAIWVDAGDAAARGRAPRLRVRRDGHQPGLHRRGPAAVRVGQARRVEAAVSCARHEASRDRRRGALRHRAGRRQDAVRAALPGRVARDRRRRAHQGRHRRLRLERHGPARAGRGRRVPRACGRRGSTAPASAARRGSSWSSTRPRRSSAGHAEVVVLVYGSTTRADLKARRREREPRRSAHAARCSSTRRSGTR